jgi:uroporphyrinogen-III synthase
MAIYPTAEQTQELMKGPGTPVVMVNLLKFKPKADESEGDVSGLQAYMRYGAKMREFVES